MNRIQVCAHAYLTWAKGCVDMIVWGWGTQSGVLDILVGLESPDEVHDISVIVEFQIINK